MSKRHQQGGGRTVVVVDPDSQVRRLLGLVLRARGYDVVEAVTGEQATQALRERDVAAVLLDDALPDDTGSGWLESARAAGFDCPVIVMSTAGHRASAIGTATQGLGAAMAVGKPVPPGQVADQLADLLRADDEADDDSSDHPLEAFARMRETYAERLPSQVRRLGALLDALAATPADQSLEGDARQLAHRIRGTAGTYGFAELGRCAGAIEDDLDRDGQWRDWTTTGLKWERVKWALDNALRDVQPTPVGSPGERRALAARILVVDDDEDFLAAIDEIARRQLVDVVHATTIADAIDAASRAALDGAILDVWLADDATAFDLASDLRSLPGNEDLPLAFISGRSDVYDRVEAAHAGASLFLAKPITDDAFDDVVRQFHTLRSADLPTVVAVDDDPDFLAHVAVALGAEGMRVHTIDDPARVLPTLDRLEPDALLLDVVMPHLDGFDVCRLLRTNPRWQELPILFLTARGDEADRIDAFRAGCDDYLVKPIVDAELRARVRVRVERRRLLQMRADRDSLTGLAMRRAFIESMTARLNEARRHDRTLAVCLLDLDEFKSINDTYGHLAGDRALTALGRLLATRFRREDLRARWGGEEFALAFPGESATTIHAAVEKLLREFSRLEITGDRGDSFTTSFSAGVAEFPTDGQTLDELLSAADARMYAAKERGPAMVVSSLQVPA